MKTDKEVFEEECIPLSKEAMLSKARSLLGAKWRHLGRKPYKKWINKLLPPIVVGPMIMIIGLSLAPTAVEEIGLNSDTVSWKNILVSLTAFLTTGILAIRGKGFLKVIPFLMGIIAGYIMSMIVGIVNYAPIVSASIIEVPKFYVPFVHYSPNFGSI